MHGCLSVGYTYDATDCWRIRFLSLKRILVEIFVDESYSCPQQTFLTSLIEFSVDGLDFCSAFCPVHSVSSMTKSFLY